MKPPGSNSRQAEIQEQLLQWVSVDLRDGEIGGGRFQTGCAAWAPPLRPVFPLGANPRLHIGRRRQMAAADDWESARA